MQNELVEKWDLSHQKIPKDKSVSLYATEKEKAFPQNCQVLDLGGGAGTDAIYFAEKGHLVTIADISNVALEIAQSKAREKNIGLSTHQVVLPKENLPFANDTFDIVYSRLSIHYFEPKDTSKIINEIKRVLKVGGKAYITVKSTKDDAEMAFLRNTAKEIETNVFLDGDDIKSRYTFDQWRDIITPAGFKNVIVQDYTEDLGNRVDVIKSGNISFILTELVLEK